jgi:hypothetical protein
MIELRKKKIANICIVLLPWWDVIGSWEKKYSLDVSVVSINGLSWISLIYWLSWSSMRLIFTSVLFVSKLLKKLSQKVLGLVMLDGSSLIGLTAVVDGVYNLKKNGK